MNADGHDGEKRRNVLVQTFVQFLENNCPRMAAALAFYTIFSLAPVLVLIVMLAGAVITEAQVQEWLQGQVGGMLGATAAEQIEAMIANAKERLQFGFSLGFVLSIGGLLFGATGAFVQLQTALNTSWGVKPDPERGGIRNMLIKRTFSLGMVLAIAFLMLVMLIVSSLISAFSGRISALLPSTLSTVTLWTLDTVINLGVLTLLFATIYKVLPDVKVAWKDVWVGGFFTTLLFVGGKFIIGFYIGRSNPGEVFGAAAALAIILLWVYYSAMIVFFGAEFTEAWAKRHGKPIEPSPGAVRIQYTEERVTE